MFVTAIAASWCAKERGQLHSLSCTHSVSPPPSSKPSPWLPSPALSPSRPPPPQNKQQDYEIDFISLSYTRSVDDVVEARAFLDAVGLQNTKIFAKLESRQSLLNFKGILNEADGIIISR